jgi:hypothetical protein
VLFPYFKLPIAAFAQLLDIFTLWLRSAMLSVLPEF